MSSKAFILAYDGAVVQSLGARATALLEGLHAEGIQAEMDLVQQCIAGRLFAEAVTIVSRQLAATLNEVPDAVALELAALRAERTYATVAARGLPLVTGVLAFAQKQSAAARLIVRADSRRAEVSRTLAMSQVEQHVTLTCCSDDRGLRRTPVGGEAEEMIEMAYRHLTVRLAALRIVASECSVCEPAAHAQNTAQRHGFRVLDSDSVYAVRPATD